MIEAVIWDIDGTLVDSEPLHLAALQTVCARYRVNISDLPDNHFVGVNLYGVWEALHERFPSDLTVANWVDELNAVYASGAGKLLPLPGALTVIRSLAIRGVRQAAVSNSNRVVVDANLLSLGIACLLEFSLSLDDVAIGKPDPEPYLCALDRLGLHPIQALAVEDSRTGVCSAKAAGMKVLGLGTHDLRADQQIAGLAEILSLFEAAKA
jgi:HAD superfamily hydrolase (TIGR01509 family)